jgi:hypothetical protein
MRGSFKPLTTQKGSKESDMNRSYFLFFVLLILWCICETYLLMKAVQGLGFWTTFLLVL